MTISVEGKELALLEGMEISGKSDLVNDGKTINSQLDYLLTAHRYRIRIWAAAS